MKTRKLITATSPDYIIYMDKPPLLGGKPQPLSVKDFQKKLNIVYDEGMSIDEKFDLEKNTFNENISGALPSTSLFLKVKDLLKNPKNNVAVCNMREAGHGLFAIETIKKNTVVAIYSGYIVKKSECPSIDGEILDFIGSDFVVCANKHHRGLASFMQHLPQKPFFNAKEMALLFGSSEKMVKLNFDFFNTEFTGHVKDKIATQNIRTEFINYHGYPIIAMVADEEILKGTQIGFSYGIQYLLAGNFIPDYFDQEGAVIPRTQYKRIFAQLHFDDFKFTGDLRPLVKQVQSGVDTIELTDDKNQYHQLSVGEVKSQLLRVNAIAPTEEKVKVVSKDSLFNTSHWERLLKKYHLTNEEQSTLEKGLRNAAFQGNKDDLHQFIKKIENLDARDSNPKTHRTALHWAAFMGHWDCYELLCKMGADPEVLDADGVSSAEISKKAMAKRLVVRA